MIQGVTEGFTEVLEVHGLGYRVSLKGNVLELSLGFSHPVLYKVPEDPYKGKGIRYKGEELRLKPGKAAGKK